MWLINVETLELQDFPNDSRPPYAILSHTWGTNETTFSAFTQFPEAAKEDGKILNTCRIAEEYGFKHVWIDTCCIDKRSSAELSEAINSMYQWYREAKVCFTYLEDVSPSMSIADGLDRCRWRTRGWTLQELIAPDNVKFFDADWQPRGSKQQLLDVLAHFTRIPTELLDGSCPLDYFEAASKMAWASGRKTSRTEDLAYCLMGIFDVNMPLLYGEGRRAFQRLQEEILKKTPDLSMLLWHDGVDHSFYPSTAERIAQAATESSPTVSSIKSRPAFLPVLASSPEDFSTADHTRAVAIDEAIELSLSQLAIVIHNDGAKLRIMEFGHATIEQPMQHWFDVRAILGDHLGRKLLPLRKIAPGTFAIENRGESMPTRGGLMSASVASKMSLVLRPGMHTVSRAIEARRRGVRVPPVLLPGYYISEVRPKSHWDPTDQIFFRDPLGTGTQAVFAIELRARDPRDRQVLIILFEPRWNESTKCKVAKLTDVVNSKSHDFCSPALHQQIFGPFTDIGFAWDLLMTRWPEVSEWSTCYHIRTGQKALPQRQRFSAKLQPSTLISFGQPIPIFDLVIVM